MFCDEPSGRCIFRVVDVSINTASTLLRQAGEACEAFQDQTVRKENESHVQCGEVWSFIFAKQKFVATAKALQHKAAPDAGAQRMRGWSQGRPSTPVLGFAGHHCGG